MRQLLLAICVGAVALGAAARTAAAEEPGKPGEERAKPGEERAKPSTRQPGFMAVKDLTAENTYKHRRRRR